jgi:hypothetical protein
MSKTYVYAIVEPGAVSVEGETGVKEAEVSVVESEGIGAVVSAAPEDELRPRRRNLKAHHGLLKSLMTEATVLPMAFGVVAESEEQVRDFLAAHADDLARQLERVRGHAEVGLRLKWNVDDIFSYFVERYDELREMRDDVFAGDGDPSRQAKIQIGELFQNLLEAEREAHRTTVEDGLSDACRAIAADDPKDETEVLNLACLIPRDGMNAFEDAVNDVAAEFDDEFLFRYTDPIAPYSFVDVEL